jgi:general secretion pathway protein E
MSAAPSETPPALAYAFAKKHGVILLSLDDVAQVGVREGVESAALIETRRALRRPLQLVPLTRTEFEQRLSQAYGGSLVVGNDGLDDSVGLDSLAEGLPAAADLLDMVDDAPVIRLINGLIAEAVRQGASDIHVEPFDTSLAIRLRIDGVLKEALTLSPRLAPLLVSRVKVMARLDIAEKRIPQDGRISLTLGGRALDVRVSTLPARAGERLVMRILRQDQAALELEELGFSEQALEIYRGGLAEPNGIILVTGPTGSGKTTSLYAGLTRLNDATRNILTIEDPVEYAIKGLGQTQVSPKVGMSFAAGLRAILRQDPDIVMVGEIRDGETAQIAVQASLTGHLVLSTVHTNNAAGAITRLRDMGVEPFLLAATVRVVVAQRLVRRLCPACRTPAAADAATARIAGVPEGQNIWRAAGCSACGQTGYAGRIGVYEAIRIDDRIRRLINEQADEDAITAAAFEKGGTLTDEVRRYVAEGLTTVEEAIRISRQDMSHGNL